MNLAGMPSGLVVAIIVAVLLAAIVGCLVAMTKMSFERRARFARFLGQAFVVLIAFGIIAGLVAQTFR